MNVREGLVVIVDKKLCDRSSEKAVVEIRKSGTK